MLSWKKQKYDTQLIGHNVCKKRDQLLIYTIFQMKQSNYADARNTIHLYPSHILLTN